MEKVKETNTRRMNQPQPTGEFVRRDAKATDCNDSCNLSSGHKKRFTFQVKQAKKTTKRRKKQPQPPGEFARVYVKATKSNDARDLSHEQLKRLLLLSVPPNMAEDFGTIFDSTVVKGGKGSKDAPKISRTSVAEVSRCFSTLLNDSKACLEEMSTVSIGMDSNAKTLSSFLFKAVVNRGTRRKSKPKRINNNHHFHESVNIVECKPHEVDDDHDWKFETVILFVPRTSSFYCKYVVNPITKKFIACPISWLRINAANGKPAKGSFIRKVVDVVYRIPSMRKVNSRITVFQSVQTSDDNKQGVFLPPDEMVIANQPVTEESANTVVLLRDEYRKQLERSTSNKKGGRIYVRGTRHVLIDPTVTLVVDPSVVGDCDVIVYLQNHKGNHTSESIVSVRQVNYQPLLSDLGTLGRRLTQAGKRGNCRGGKTDLGGMYTLGKVSLCDGVRDLSAVVEKSAEMKGILRRVCEGAYEQMCDIYPEVTSEICNMDRNNNAVPDESLGGNEKGISSTMIMSFNLGNATHYDINDASYCYSVWTELKPGQADNWYFVLPNVITTKDGITYTGMAIRLFHGVAIAWDGRVIRHGTSATFRGTENNHVFGTFWGSRKQK